MSTNLVAVLATAGGTTSVAGGLAVTGDVAGLTATVAGLGVLSTLRALTAHVTLASAVVARWTASQ